MILENFTDMKDRERQRELKVNVGSLMSSNYDKYIKTVGPFTKRQIPSQSSDRYQNTTVTTGASFYQTTSSTMTSPPTSSSHDFVARILRLSQGLSSDGQYEVVVVTMVMFDGAVLLNGTKVKDVINSIEEDRLGEDLGSTYYSGSLYKEPTASTSFYVQWITGIAGGEFSAYKCPTFSVHGPNWSVRVWGDAHNRKEN